MSSSVPAIKPTRIRLANKKSVISVVPSSALLSSTSSEPVLLLLFGLLLLMNVTHCAPAPSYPASQVASPIPTKGQEDRRIHLYEDSHFQGTRSRLRVGHFSCVNLMGKLNDFFSSVDTLDGCYFLCEHHNCRGRCERVQGRIPLSRVDLNDKVSSLRSCSEESREELQIVQQDWQNEIDYTKRPPEVFTFLFNRRRFKRSAKFSNKSSRRIRIRTSTTTAPNLRVLRRKRSLASLSSTTDWVEETPVTSPRSVKPFPQTQRLLRRLARPHRRRRRKGLDSEQNN